MKKVGNPLNFQLPDIQSALIQILVDKITDLNSGEINRESEIFQKFVVPKRGARG